MIDFHLDSRSGVSPYMQIVQQVRHALRLGLLEEGDQLPTVKEVVASLAINPNTVLKAYRELEHSGSSRRGRGSARSSPARWRIPRSPRTARCGASCAAGLSRRGAPAWMRSRSRRSFTTLFVPPASRG